MPKKLSREMLEALVDIQMNITKMEFCEMMDYLVNSIVKTLAVKRCSIFKTFDNIACLITGTPKEEHGIGMIFTSNDLPLLKEVVDRKSYLFVKNPGQDERTINTRELIYVKGINAILLIPLIAEKIVIGVIAIDIIDAKSFSDEEISFCLILADIVSLLLERDYLRKEKEKKELLTILGELVMEFSHEVRNPLMSVGGFAKRLRKEINGNNVYERELDIIIENSKRLEDFIKKVVVLSRKNGTEFIVPENNFNIEEVFNRLIQFKTS